MYKSDIEIAQSTEMLPIAEIAASAGIDDIPLPRERAKQQRR